MEHIPDTNKSGNSEQFNLSENTTWEARKPFVIGKEIFEFELEFVKEIQHKTGVSLIDIIKQRAPVLSRHVFEYDKEDKFIGLKPGINEENIVDAAYEEYLKTYDEKPVEYHPDGSTRFGCFYYDQENTKQLVKLHFSNKEFDTIGPLDKKKINLRKKEIHDLLSDVKKLYPNTKEVSCTSWLLNIESFKRLFPQSYLDNLKVDDRRVQWARGPTIWGQFIDSEYDLKKDLTNELLRRVKKLPKDSPISDVFKEGPPLMAPLEARGPIDDFYKMYGIEK